MNKTPLPATGAWRPGDAPGPRQFFTFATDRPFALEGGQLLDRITIAYETWGQLDADGTNAILVCHALTGDSHVAGSVGPSHPASGWWEGVVGPGLALDTDRYFIVCNNVLGGCQGSTGPSSMPLDDARPYGSRFPTVTIRDMVRSANALGDHLGVRTWLSVVGGSMGGMQVLEWAVTFPSQVRSIIPIATTAQATAQQIALGSVGRRAIRLDPKWRDGDYYDAAPGDGPHEGLAIARMLAQITYRSDDVFTDRFGRQLADVLDGGRFGLWQRFEVERYLEYHGDKLARRFDANSYLAISKAMDLHDIGRGRGGLRRALARVTAPVLSIGISSDTLYPPYQQRLIRDVLRAAGGDCDYVEIDSPHGHDAFLIDVDAVGAAVTTFLERVQKADPQEARPR